MTPFLRALNWGSLPLLIYFALRRYLQAVNVVHPITFALVSANLINLVGDWALIYGHLGMPAMGIVGSGWSTCFSRIYLVAVLLITLLWVESKRKMETWKGALRLELRRMLELLRLGIPAATQILFEIGAFAVATTMCARIGPMALAGHEIALSYAALTFMVPLGISSAAAVRVGQEIGRGDPAAARRAGWSAIILGAGSMACSAALFVSFSKTLARVFSPDPEVVQVGSTLLLVAAGIPTIRRNPNLHDWSPARRWRHPYAHAGKFWSLLVYRAPVGIHSRFQATLGRAGGLAGLVCGFDFDWQRIAVGLAQAEIKSTNATPR